MTFRRYTCRTVRDMLPLHVGGDLDPKHVTAVDEHLHGCLSCFREFRELATLRGRLGVLAEEPLPRGVLDGFTDEVMARIAVGEPGPAAPPPGRVVRLVTLPRLAAAAALLLAVSLGVRIALEGIGVEPIKEMTAGQPMTTGQPIGAGQPIAATDLPVVERDERPTVGWPAPGLRSGPGVGSEQPVSFGAPGNQASSLPSPNSGLGGQQVGRVGLWFGELPEELLRQAEQALREAHGHGRPTSIIGVEEFDRGALREVQRDAPRPRRP